MAIAVASAVIVSACSHDKGKPVVRTVYPAVSLPGSARQTCNPPSVLPDRDMTAREVTTNWGADRAALLTCETRRAAAVAAVDTAGAKP